MSSYMKCVYVLVVYLYVTDIRIIDDTTTNSIFGKDWKSNHGQKLL